MTTIFGPAILFCPGDRPERFAKAAAAADMAVLDLEDAVAPAAKPAARDAVCAWLRERSTDVLVRVNDPATEIGRADAKAVLDAGGRAILICKTETVAQIDTVAQAGPETPAILVIIESARGLLALPELLAHPAVAGVSWGPYDLAADMGLRAVRDEAGLLLPILHEARNTILIHAAAARVPAYDTVTAELSDGSTMLERDAREAALLGFVGKFMIHPSQAETVRAAFRPSAEEIDRSRRLLAAMGERGAFLFEGDMVDEPIMRRARNIIAMADRFNNAEAARDE